MVLKRGARKRSGESARRDVFFFPMSTFQCFVGFAALTFYFLTNGTWKPRSPTNYVRNDWTDHMSANHRAPVTFGEKKVHWFFFVPPQPKHKKIKQTSHFLQKTCKESENIEHKPTIRTKHPKHRCRSVEERWLIEEQERGENLCQEELSFPALCTSLRPLGTEI